MGSGNVIHISREANIIQRLVILKEVYSIKCYLFHSTWQQLSSENLLNPVDKGNHDQRYSWVKYRSVYSRGQVVCSVGICQR